MGTSLRILFLSALFLGQAACATGQFPDHWWAPVEGETPSWEITPDTAERGQELILSKRNELGVFSNLGAAEFEFDGYDYASVEGLWQMLKYPDPKLKRDKRKRYEYPYNRKQVRALSGFDSKDAGKFAGKINKANGIDYVSYRGEKFKYKDHSTGSARHFDLISGAIRAKVMQNEEIKNLLLSTGDLKLLPDHTIRDSSPPAYYYNEILMDLRAELREEMEKNKEPKTGTY